MLLPKPSPRDWSVVGWTAGFPKVPRQIQCADKVGNHSCRVCAPSLRKRSIDSSQREGVRRHIRVSASEKGKVGKELAWQVWCELPSVGALCAAPPRLRGVWWPAPIHLCRGLHTGKCAPSRSMGGVVGAHFHTDGSDGWSVNFQRNAILRVNCTSVNIVVFVYPPALHFLQGVCVCMCSSLVQESALKTFRLHMNEPVAIEQHGYFYFPPFVIGYVRCSTLIQDKS